MAEMKTRENAASESAFLKGISDRDKRADCRSIAGMMRHATGRAPKMRGESIVGSDRYETRYASRRSGSYTMSGFSPRARKIAIRIMPGFRRCGALPDKPGRYRTGRSCLYNNRLAETDPGILAELIRSSAAELRRKYGDSQ